jgi:excisionase family DNA binding protein
MSSATIKHITEVPSEQMDALLLKLHQIENKVNGDAWLTTEEAALYIKLSETHLLKIKNEIGFSKPGNDLKFRKSDLDKYLMKHYKPGKLS